MDSADSAGPRVSRIAAAIGDPSRARMLCSLMDGHARTATELAIVAGISPATASVHFSRLREEQLIKVMKQGKHRYYALEGPNVASLIENLLVVSGASDAKFVPNTPHRLRSARTCYDHIAGKLGVDIHDRLLEARWLAPSAESKAAGHGRADPADAYRLTDRGRRGFAELGGDVARAEGLRRRLAFGCVDWSERRPHLGGALGAELLRVARKRRWLTQHERLLSISPKGKLEIQHFFGLDLSNGLG